MFKNGFSRERISELTGTPNVDKPLILDLAQNSHRKSTPGKKKLSIPGILKLIRPVQKMKIPEISVTRDDTLIGRGPEIEEIKKYVSAKISVILYGPAGCGKTAILKKIENSIFISVYRKKQSLVKIILEGRGRKKKNRPVETEKALKRLSVNDLLNRVKGFGKTIIIDNITELSKIDRIAVAELSKHNTVVSSTSRFSDIKLFKTYMEIKPLKRHHMC